MNGENRLLVTDEPVRFSKLLGETLGIAVNRTMFLSSILSKKKRDNRSISMDNQADNKEVRITTKLAQSSPCSLTWIGLPCPMWFIMSTEASLAPDGVTNAAINITAAIMVVNISRLCEAMIVMEFENIRRLTAAVHTN